MVWMNIIIDGKGLASAQILPQLHLVLIFTLGLQLLPRRVFRELKYPYYYLAAEYYLCFPFGFCQLVNSLHTSKFVDSDCLLALLAVAINANNRLLWLYVEDIIFGDLGVLRNVI